MNRCVVAERLRRCVERLLNSGLLRALFALIRAIPSRHTLDPELNRGSLAFIVTKHPVCGIFARRADTRSTLDIDVIVVHSPMASHDIGVSFGQD